MGSFAQPTIVGTITTLVLAGGTLIPQAVAPEPAQEPAARAAQGSTTDSGQATVTRAQAQLRADLDAILDQPGLGPAQASAMVRTSAGTELYARDDTERLLPASNMKLFTSAAALEILGPGHRFATDVAADGPVRGSTLDGDLYLRGTGDPSLLVEDLDELAAKVAASGIDTVDGRLVADDTAFDDVRLGDSWTWDDESASYAPQISALTLSPDDDYDTGTVRVDVRPGSEVGSPADVTVVPASSYVRIVNRVTTSSPSGSPEVSARRAHGTNRITVTGELPAGADVDRSRVSVWEPTLYTAGVFRAALARHGVEVTGDTTSGATPGGVLPLAERRSAPLAELMVPLLKLSNNGHAEMLVKAMGRVSAGEGSWSAGLDAMSEALAGLDVDTTTLRFADGSGLSRKDLLTSRQVTGLLLEARNRPWFDTWHEALPIAGVADQMVGGTLGGRMRGTAAEGNVHAKTGSLTGVTALSGYVTDADGELLVFSVIHNNHLGVNPKVMEDQIAVRLAEFTRRQAPPVRRGDGAKNRRIPSLPATDYGRDGVECSWVKAC